ncbi:MAG TPA: hypothetical protein VNG53_09750, partial [Bacteroidia bacterium]|nr:hypothetical protein [Bacteroidia bacterium]
MSKRFSYASTLLKRLFIVLLTYWVCRILFFAFNRDSFASVSWIKIIEYSFFGTRFDISAILFTNIPFILLSLLPITLRDTNTYQKFLKIIFIVTNSITLFANCADFVYFQITLKRCTADVFSFMALGNDTLSLLPGFLLDYWYVIVIWILMILLLFFLYKKTEEKKQRKNIFSLQYFITHILILCFAAAIVVIGFRGGFQLRPMGIINASEYTNPQNIPLIINTPFSIINTFEDENISPKKYLTEQIAEKYYSPIHKNNGKKFRKLNVVVLILESFSKEYIGSMNPKLGKSNTPFLDSLFSQSLVFE